MHWQSQKEYQPPVIAVANALKNHKEELIFSFVVQGLSVFCDNYVGTGGQAYRRNADQDIPARFIWGISCEYSQVILDKPAVQLLRCLLTLPADNRLL